MTSNVPDDSLFFRCGAMYDSEGWTNKFIPLIEQATGCKMPKGVDYCRFDGLPADTAQTLLEQVPEDALWDAQNDAPPLKDLLKICVDNPDTVTLEGYVITELRFDERITVDGILVTCDYDHATTTWDEAWEYMKDLLALPGDTQEPDLLQCKEIDRNGSAVVATWEIWWD